MSSMQISRCFEKVNRSYTTRPGWRLATFQEVRENFESIKEQGLLTGKERARLLDGWISGPSYNFQMENNFRFCIGYMLVIQSHPQENHSSDDSGKELYEGVNLTEEGKQAALLLCCEDWNYEVVYWLLNSWDQTETMNPRDVSNGMRELNNAPAVQEMKQLNNLINDLARKLGETSISVKAGNEKLTLRSIKDVLSDLWRTSCWNRLTESHKALLGRSFENHLAIAYRSVGQYWIQDFDSHTDSADVLWNVMWDHFSAEVLRICTTLSFQVVIHKWKGKSSQVTESHWNFILSTSILQYIHKSILDHSLLFKEKHRKYSMLEKLMTVPCDGNFNVLDKVLQLAAGEGDVVIIKKMLDYGAHALTQNQEKQTALHVAFIHIKDEDKIEKVVKILLDRCDAKEQLVNAQDGGGKTVLHLASSKGKGKICRFLLDNEAKPDAKDNCDRLPLHYAVEGKNDEVVDVLIGRNAIDEETIHMIQSCKDKDGKTPLDIGVGQKNIKLLTKILPILDQPSEIYFNSVDNGKLLRHFALEGKTDLVRKLLERGVSPLDVDEDGRTALHHAAMCEDDFRTTDTIDLWLKCQDRKKLISMCDNKGKTTLHVIAYKGYSSLENKVFADLQDLVDVRDREGRNSLYDAAEGKSDISDPIHVIVSMMEKKGITLDDMIDHRGLTPLHVAASQGKVFQSDVLLRRSKHPNKYVKMADYKGQTALHKAAEGGHVDTIKVLFHWGAQPLLERDWQGRTALHYAVLAKTGEDRICSLVELLLKKCGSDERRLLLLRMSAEGLGTAEKILKDFSPLKSFLEYKMEEFTNEGFNLLRTAACLGHTEMTKQLLREGAKIEDLYYVDWYASRRHEEKDNVEKVLGEIRRNPVQANDQPSVEDYLGRADFAYGIAALLLNPYVEPPIAIGICGSWGMGKSSLMGQTELILLGTAAQSALLPTFKSSEIHGDKDLMLSEKGQKIYEEIGRWVDSLEDDSNVFEYFLMWMKTIPLRFKNRILGRKRKNPYLGRRWDNRIWFVNNYEPGYRSIFKSLAAMDRSCMFTREGGEYYSKIITVPAIITVQYNAWKYRNESEALAGLAVEITKEMEGLMTESQWLSTCWRNTWRSQKQTILINVIFPCVLAIFLAGTFAWILWLLLDVYNVKEAVKLKYASLPATIVIMAWSVGKSVMSTLNPVSTQLLNYMKFPDHTDKLGYQERLISDITFLKGEIRRKPFFLCTAASCIWHLITSCCMILYLWPKFFRETMLNRKAASPCTSHEKDDPRIIVFVDDLDRCQESVILQVLSAINLVLAVCKISVIVGMDKAMINQAIIKRHGDNSLRPSDHSKQLAEKYLQKIIQLSLDLPDPSQLEFRRFLEVQIGVLAEQIKEPETEPDDDGDYNALFSPFERRNEIIDNVKEMSIPEKLLEEPQVATQMETDASDTRIEVAPIVDEAGDRGSSKLIPVTEMLFVRYTPQEREAFCYFQTMVTGHRKLPRQWKCLLYYHRWVWCICFMRSEIRSLVGWDVELIVWIFICWEWQDNMNILIKEWNKIDILKTSKSESAFSGPSLGDIVEYHIENDENMVQDSESKEFKPQKPKEDLREKEVSFSNTEEMKVEKMKEDLKGKGIYKNTEDPGSSKREQSLKETKQKTGKNKKIDKNLDEKKLKNWRRMKAALNNYDVSMKGIQAFQRFRFFCEAGHIEWPLPKQET